MRSSLLELHSTVTGSLLEPSDPEESIPLVQSVTVIELLQATGVHPDDQTTLAPRGRFDSYTAHQLKQELKLDFPCLGNHMLTY